MKKKVIIVINAFSPASSNYQTERFVEEFEKRGVIAEVRKNDGFPVTVSHEITLTDFDCDFCLYLDKDKYVSSALEKRGIKLFNSARSIELCDDKMTTHIALSGYGIPMPKTVPGLLCYDADALVKREELDEIERRLGYPVIIKQSYGSLGKGVFKADDRAELEKTAEFVRMSPHLFQEFIEPAGCDMRVIVVGDEVLGGIERISETDFRSNIGLGARAEKTSVPQDIKKYALAAAKTLGLDYCGIDFLLGADGPLLCEVNSNAFFGGFESTTGINVAGAFADHMLTTVHSK